MRRWLWSAPLVLGLCACSAGGGATGDPFQITDPNNNGGTGGSSTGPGTAGTGGGVSTPEPIAGDPTARCAASRAGGPDVRRLSRFELERSLGDIFPMVSGMWTSTLSPDAVSPGGFDNDTNMLVVSRQSARELADTAESVGKAVSGTALAGILPCASSAPGPDCAGQFIDSFGRRFFRRPLTAAERGEYVDFYNTAFGATNNFAQSIAWVTRGFIEAPNFLYRREVGAVEGGLRKLSQFEIATELAYTFSASTPSDALLDRAGRGELSSPEVLVQSARELLTSPRGKEVVQHFFDSFVGYGRVSTIGKTNNAQAFEAVRSQMAEETRRFIEEVVVTRSGGLRELLTADFTLPSAGLSSFYGFPAPAGDYAVTPRPAGRGIGLLAQGAFLSTNAQPHSSSPTKRGQWVFKHLLCQVIPPVPANVPEIKPPREGITTRQRYEEEHAVPGSSCANCHTMWDPIGFGLEHFDEVGKYRDTEGSPPLPIDSVSYVPDGPLSAGKPHHFDFTTQEELARGLAELPLANECVSGAVATFAFGAELTCAGESKRQDFIEGTMGFVDYLASLAGEPQFSQRAPNEE